MRVRVHACVFCVRLRVHERVRMHARAYSRWQRLGQSERVYSLTPEVMFQVTGACDAGRCGGKAIEILQTRSEVCLTLKSLVLYSGHLQVTCVGDLLLSRPCTSNATFFCTYQ